jgi:hypothetical protein
MNSVFRGSKWKGDFHMATIEGRYDDFKTRKKKAEMRQKEQEKIWEEQWHLNQALKSEEERESDRKRLLKLQNHIQKQNQYDEYVRNLQRKEMRLQKERDDAQDRKWAEIRNKKFEKEQQYGVGEYQIGHDKEKWALATLDMKEDEMYDQETVIKKYKELAVKYNPATNPDDKISEAIFGWVNEAYDFLSPKSNEGEFSITTKSDFNFSGPPLGFQKNKYFVNMGL